MVAERKTYSRKALIRYFAKLPPESKPCTDNRCPIAVYMGFFGYEANIDAYFLDQSLAASVDRVVENYQRLKASRIVKVARSLP